MVNQATSSTDELAIGRAKENLKLIENYSELKSNHIEDMGKRKRSFSYDDGLAFEKIRRLVPEFK
jgi:hypothetical protein